MIVLAGDIGGTNARLALAVVEGDRVRLSGERRFPSQAYGGLAPIVTEFLKSAAAGPERACLGLPGHVTGDTGVATNLPWAISARELAAATGIASVRFINDFEAVGYGVPGLGAADLVTLQAGQPEPRGPIALIGAGTGLGEGFVVWEGSRYRVVPSEGGHADFAARDAAQFALAQYLHGKYGHVSRERVISGPGLADAYRYLASAAPGSEQPAVRAEMASEDPAAVVTRHALAGTDALCGRALDLFVEAFGATAGNLALTVLATGGVYLAGGIAPRIVERLRAGRFLEAFRDKGRMASFLARVPVHVIVNPDVGLVGAAVAAGRES